MNPRFSIDEKVRETQARATDPQASAWVSANAGSGKTFVLARRVIRLLLAGADPSSILCLTFTKAAAAEMSSRVFAILAAWTTMADEALAAVLADYEGRPAGPERRAEARRLFARALETPGGLKIQTIHAFCERLLHQFPFEANVAGRFEVLDERQAAMLGAEAQRSVLAEAAAAPETPLGRAFARVLEAASDQGIEAALDALVAQRDALRGFIRASGSLDAARAALRRELGLSPGDTTDALRAALVDASPLRPDLRRLIDVLHQSDKATDLKLAQGLADVLDAPDEAAAGEAYAALFFTSAGTPRKTMVTKAVRDRWPGLDEALAGEIERLTAGLDRVGAAETFEATDALLVLGDAVVARYERGKQARGALDFEDLVVKTAMLLARSDASAWVYYKLDRGLDHILIDEAQDTSPRQWQVIAQLGEEFFAGAGARPGIRTLFAVGDEKQSIYSFQGAVPAWFGRQRRRLGQRARDAEAAWHDLELTLSFRSTPDVLAAVDAVFEPEDAHRGLTGEPQPTVHQAARRHDPGRVTLWPPIAAEKLPEPEDWHTPLDHLDEKAPEVRLAERIAGTIRRWLDDGARIAATGARIRPGNILILTRKRGPQTDAINRALKAEHLPVAGADRLALLGHIAILDLMALGDFVLLPEDDLTLAALLKSPLVGLTEDQLFALAHGRSGSLWQAMEKSAEPAVAAARERLSAWRARADFDTPHGFFARILGPEGGRRRFLARLGSEAEEVLDEFLAQALAHEASETPSLQAFLGWLRASATSIKRDADLRRDEIRVMTVHGAKGLEADIVFLVDTGSKPVHASHDPKVLALSADPDDAEGAPLVWLAPGTRRPQRVTAVLDGWRERQREEYRRLLYVGLTRARDHLIVCGTAKANVGAERLWHDLVGDALRPGARTVEVTLGDDHFEALEWSAGEAKADAEPAEPAAASGAPAPLPDWVSRPAPAAPAIPRRLTPSALVAPAEPPPAFRAVDALEARLDPASAAALDRGRIIHRLLLALPEIAPEARAATMQAYLDAVAIPLPKHERETVSATILTTLSDPAFAAIFAPGGRGEVPIAGLIETADGPAAVSGRIDRLVVTAERVTIVDYKTNRVPPATLEGVPEDYLGQLALYRAVLQGLYPDRAVEAALLWTATPALMPIPAARLDDRILRLKGS